MRSTITIAVLLLLGGMLGSGCDQSIGGDERANQAPLIFISSGPLEGDPNTNYNVQFFWNGYDPDGRVENFEYMITDDEVTGSLIIDENVYASLEARGYEWTEIEVHDSVFVVSADSIPMIGDSADSIYFYGDGRFLFRAQHTFFIRAVDEDGDHSEIPAHRSFTATTIAPEVKIVHPDDVGGVGGYDDLPPDIFFRWSGNDSVGNGTIIEPDSTRYALLIRGDLGIDLQTAGMMLEFPDSIWSIWRHWDEVDSLNESIGGKRTLLTGLTPFERYLFFVQAKDEAGAITSHYEDGNNLRKMRVVNGLQPTIVVRERSLGVRVSDHNQSFFFTIAEGQLLELRWAGSADAYGSEVTGYRYGWDILDTANDEEWTSWSQANTSTENSFVSGTHTFYLEARDFSGTTTRLIFDFFVVPFTMEEDLLFIDDYDNDPSDDDQFSWPGSPFSFNWGTFYHTNPQMRAFWDDILEPYSGFFSDRDFFRVTPTNDKPPFETVANYRRIIWEVKEEDANESGIGRVATFVDTYVPGLVIPFDYVSAFLDRGGQALICGSRPVFATLPRPQLMGSEGYFRKGPLAFLKHLGYSEGSANESTAAVQRYLFWKQFGLDAVVKPTDQTPRAIEGITGADFKTTRTFWGMVSAGYTGEELAFFPNTQGDLPETVMFRPDVYEWFAAAGPVFNNPDDWIDPGQTHHEFGLNEIEIYNWDWFGQVFDPPLNYRTSQYIPLLTYNPADSTTRWGTDPAPTHIFLTINDEFYRELRYSTGGQGRHAVAVIGMKYPETPSVLLGLTPYFLENDTAKTLLDHILVDILEMPE